MFITFVWTSAFYHAIYCVTYSLDEFNKGSELNSTDWRHEVQKAGWVNNELQNYANGSADGKRVTEIADNRLYINCFKGSNGKIYSGRVYAHETQGWLYGIFEARIKLPKGKGTWPAFWMMTFLMVCLRITGDFKVLMRIN